MFERYTEHARRAIFFARYEASQFGSDQIEPEHFLLALFREDPALMKRCAPVADVETIRARIQNQIPPRQRVSTSVDMPLSDASKRLMAYGAQEANGMDHPHIGTEHHLLGLLREPCVASRILNDLGVTLEAVREEIARSGRAAEPKPMNPEEAAAEREALRALIASLPDEALGRARSVLEHARASPHPGMLGLPAFSEVRRRMRERKGNMGAGGIGAGAGGWQEGGWQEGHFSSSRMEDGTMIFETRRIHKGHSITLIERIRLSDDGKTLHYSQELRAPNGEHSWSKDFDIP